MLACSRDSGYGSGVFGCGEIDVWDLSCVSAPRLLTTIPPSDGTHSLKGSSGFGRCVSIGASGTLIAAELEPAHGSRFTPRLAVFVARTGEVVRTFTLESVRGQEETAATFRRSILHSCHFSQTENELVTAQGNGPMRWRVWNTETGNCICDLPWREGTPCPQLQSSNITTVFAHERYDSQSPGVDVYRSLTTPIASLDACGYRPTHGAVDPSGSVLAVASMKDPESLEGEKTNWKSEDDLLIQVWRMDSWKELCHIEVRRAGKILAIYLDDTYEIRIVTASLVVVSKRVRCRVSVWKGNVPV